jgi:tetratricopeptide (TPR) repeat protein
MKIIYVLIVVVALMMEGCVGGKEGEGELSVEEIKRLCDEAGALEDKGKYTEAKVKILQAYKAFEILHEKDKKIRVQILIGLCNISKGLQENDKTIEYANEIAIHATRDADRASAYGFLGAASNNKGEYDKAIGYYKKALPIFLETYGSEHLIIATCNSELGKAYHAKREHDKAIGYHEKALAIHLKIHSENGGAGSTLSDIGEALREKGEYDKAVVKFEEALSIYLKTVGSKHPFVAMARNNLGITYLAKGDLEEAKEYLNKALPLLLETMGPEHPWVAANYNNQGGIYTRMHKFEKAIEFTEKCLEIEVKTLGTEHPSVAGTYGNLGFLYDEIGNDNKARGCFESALSIFRKSFGPDHSDTKIMQKWVDSYE